jgi:hypothetical protein
VGCQGSGERGCIQRSGCPQLRFIFACSPVSRRMPSRPPSRYSYHDSIDLGWRLERQPRRDFGLVYRVFSRSRCSTAVTFRPDDRSELQNRRRIPSALSSRIVMIMITNIARDRGLGLAPVA